MLIRFDDTKKPGPITRIEFDLFDCGKLYASYAVNNVHQEWVVLDDVRQILPNIEQKNRRVYHD